MDENCSGSDKISNVDDLMLPGFRFHPTDEELVGFYLKRKLQQRPLSIELIKQVDIYKYDPWDLPKLVSTGEKEWYFYCPRDRKYRNSSRPNRVTGSGFWKATGTDRPIYSSDGNKCIGLKKSLVFYIGRAAKGMKTDWMMHEFRLPAASDGSSLLKKPLDKSLPPNDSWAICRIFKKVSSMAQRGLANSWEAPFCERNSPDAFAHSAHQASFNSTENRLQEANFTMYRTDKPSADYLPSFSPPEETSGPMIKNLVDLTSILFDSSPDEAIETPEGAYFEGQQDQFSSLLVSDPTDMTQECLNIGGDHEQVRSMGFSCSFPMPGQWDSPACGSELSSTDYSNNCYR